MAGVSKLQNISKNEIIRIGSRESPLALAQVHEVETLLRQQGIRLNYELRTFKTAGDKDKKTLLTSNPADDFFTNTIDQALLNGQIDAAIHSAKDLPQNLHPHLEIVALTTCLDDTDVLVSPISFAKLPPGSRIGTSSFMRQESIKAMRPDIKLVNIRGTIQERMELIKIKKVDGIITASCALKRLKLGHLIQDVFPWETTPLQGQLAVICRRGNEQFKKIFHCLDVKRSYGKVYLIGAGPGDQELITLKAINILKKSDCVFYDYLVDPALLRFASRAEHIYVGKRKGCHALSQSELSRRLRLKAVEGKIVARLKGGDPLIFGRGADEMAYLRSFHVPVEVIPGISSATGIPSVLGIPLTARGVSSSVAFVSAHGEGESTSGKDTVHIPDTQTIVFLMGLSKLSLILQSLRKRKWNINTPIAIISRGTRRDQHILIGTLATIEALVRKNPVKPPSLIIVGKTVDFYRPSREFKKILFLGTHPQEYRSLGQLIHWPMIKIAPVKFTASQRNKMLHILADSKMVLLTSEYAVEFFFKLLSQRAKDIAIIKNKDFAVIGGHTAQALLDKGVHPKFIASQETSQGMFAELKKRLKLKGVTIIFPRSSLPNPYLKTALTKAGADVSEIAVYQNVKPKKRALPNEEIQSIIFTSPSTVTNFINDYGKIPAHWEILCKGPVSQQMLAKHGYSAQVITR